MYLENLPLFVTVGTDILKYDLYKTLTSLVKIYLHSNDKITNPL